jgi:hypothetical protein
MMYLLVSQHVETPINTSSFLHPVGYLFTFMYSKFRGSRLGGSEVDGGRHTRRVW